MILDLDIGNSRIKWRAQLGVGEYSDGVCATVSELTRALSDRGLLPSRVRVSCVGQPSQIDALNKWLVRHQLLQCELAVAGASAGPVRSGYEQPVQLGVDRWLAVCAAWQCVGGPVVVVDGGSALTVDFIDGDACHLGGYIVPGLAMQQASLLSATEKVRFDDVSLQSTLPGINTGQAVGRGIARMSSALIERAVMDFNQRLGAEVSLLLTGGDAAAIGQILAIPFVVVPDLVLRGIALVMD
jgi:type III pantothenate kinase